MSKIKVIVEKTSTGYSCFSDDLPGVISAGKKWSELKNNMREAVELHIEGLKEDGDPYPANYNLEFSLDVEELFMYYKLFNVSAFAKRVHINNTVMGLYRTGKRIPSEKTSEKILDGLHQFGKELMSEV